MSPVLRPCRHPDCGTLVQLPKNRCPKHERSERGRRKASGLTGKRGSTSAWRRLRNQVIVRAGFCCERPGCANRFTPASPAEVHHKDGNSRNNSIDNLEALCHDCHVEAEAEKKGSSR